MAIVNQGDPNLLVFRSGGGFLTFFGLPFLLAGLFAIALTLGLVSVKRLRPWRADSGNGVSGEPGAVQLN